MELTTEQVREMARMIGLDIPDADLTSVAIRLSGLLTVMEEIERDIGDRMDEVDPVPPAARVCRHAMTRFPSNSLTTILPEKSRFLTVQDAAWPVTVNRAGIQPLKVPLSITPDAFTTRHRPSILSVGSPETSMTKV